MDDGSERVYTPADLETMVPLSTSIYNDGVLDAEWSPNGTYLAVSIIDRPDRGIFQIYSFDDDQLIIRGRGNEGSDVSAVSWRPGGSLIAYGIGGSVDQIKVSTFDGSVISVMTKTDFPNVRSLEWSPDGRFLAATGDGVDEEVMVYSYDGISLNVVATFDLVDGGTDLTWSPDGTRLAVTWVDQGMFTSTGILTVLGFDGNSLSKEWEDDHGSDASCTEWSPDGGDLAIGYTDAGGSLRVYRTSEDDTGRLVMERKDSESLVFRPSSISWSPTGHNLAAVGSGSGSASDSQVFMWYGETALTSLWRRDRFYLGSGTSVDWSPDGMYVALAGSTNNEDLQVLQARYFSLSADDEAETTEDTTVTIDVLANDWTTSGNLTITEVDGVVHGQVEVTADGRDLVYTPLANWSGNERLTYRHSDMLDTSPSAVVNITVLPVNDVPVITTEDVVVATEDEHYQVFYEALDADSGDVLTWSFDSDGEWLSFNTTSGALSGLPKNEDVGAYWVNVSVTDSNGTSDVHGFLIRVRNANDPPTILTEDVLEVDQDDLYSVYYHAEDADPTGDQLVWSLDTEAEWLSMEGNHLFGTPRDHHVRDHPVRVMVSDGMGGFAWTVFNITVRNVNDRPEIITEPVSFATEDEEYHVTYEVRDLDEEDSIQWFLDGPDWLEMGELTGLLSGTPTNDDVGAHTVTITVYDGRLENWLQYLLYVENVNDAPVWVSTPGDQELMEGNPMVLDVRAEDDDGDPITYNLSSTPGSDIAINPTSGAVHWLDAEPGTYRVEITATDGTETITRVLSVSVEAEPEPPVPPVNGVPVIGAVQDKVAKANETFTLALSGSDPDPWDEGNLTFRLVSGPEGLVVSAEGVILWLPTSGQAGEYQVVVSLSDTKNSTVREFNVVVKVVSDDNGGIPSDDGDYLWLVIALAIVVVVLAVLMLWMYMGRK